MYSGFLAENGKRLNPLYQKMDTAIILFILLTFAEQEKEKTSEKRIKKR